MWMFQSALGGTLLGTQAFNELIPRLLADTYLLHLGGEWHKEIFCLATGRHYRDRDSNPVPCGP